MDREKLIATIMRECANDGEPVTHAEAEEMADMELKARSDKRYEKADKPRTKVERKRKVDPIKVQLVESIANFLSESYFGIANPELNISDIDIVKPEREIAFILGGESYSVVLTKHREKK